MARKALNRSEENHENHERWLVSYADFITLLFAFFVVMYAISSINDGKYKVLSGSLIHAFKNPAAIKNTEQQFQFSPIVKEEPQYQDVATVEKDRKRRVRKQKVMQSIAQDVLQVLAPLISDGKVRVTQSHLGITVEINASVLFSPGEALLSDESAETLNAVARVLRSHQHAIRVEGHTDNLPIHTDHFPSNWELSTARASSVIRLFEEGGVNGRRLTAVGYSKNKPVETNDTIEGRMRNRRVSIMIMSNDHEDITEFPVNLN